MNQSAIVLLLILCLTFTNAKVRWANSFDDGGLGIGSFLDGPTVYRGIIDASPIYEMLIDDLVLDFEDIDNLYTWSPNVTTGTIDLIVSFFVNDTIVDMVEYFELAESRYPGGLVEIAGIIGVVETSLWARPVDAVVPDVTYAVTRYSVMTETGYERYRFTFDVDLLAGRLELDSLRMVYDSGNTFVDDTAVLWANALHWTSTTYDGWNQEKSFIGDDFDVEWKYNGWFAENILDLPIVYYDALAEALTLNLTEAQAGDIRGATAFLWDNNQTGADLWERYAFSFGVSCVSDIVLTVYETSDPGYITEIEVMRGDGTWEIVSSPAAALFPNAPNMDPATDYVSSSVMRVIEYPIPSVYPEGVDTFSLIWRDDFFTQIPPWYNSEYVEVAGVSLSCSTIWTCEGKFTTSDVCSGHGSCTAPDSCTCDEGFVGDLCETEIPTTQNVPVETTTTSQALEVVSSETTTEDSQTSEEEDTQNSSFVLTLALSLMTLSFC
jgi:hypothetical protein